MKGQWRRSERKARRETEKKQPEQTWLKRNAFHWVETEHVTCAALSTKLFFLFPFPWFVLLIKQMLLVAQIPPPPNIAHLHIAQLHMSMLRSQHTVIDHCQHLSKTTKTSCGRIIDEHATGRGLASVFLCVINSWQRSTGAWALVFLYLKPYVLFSFTASKQPFLKPASEIIPGSLSLMSYSHWP